MKKEFNASNRKQYSGDRVIARGYEIYDEWINGRRSSRDIVSHIERTASSVQKKRTPSAYVEALSCLFALDMRMQEKYSHLLRCLFSYFSWRREGKAQKLLRSALDLPIGVGDIRTAIEVALQRLREKMEEGSEEGDDETSGGKRNGKAEEEATVAEEKGQEQAPEEKAEELTEAEESKEATEEKAQDASEQAPEETVTESGEQPQAEDLSQETNELAAKEETAPLEQEAPSELAEFKEENNGTEEKAEPSTDKKEEAKAYHDVVDFSPLYEETVRDRSAEQTSLIDEMIMDNMTKGEKDIMGHQRINEAERNRESDIPQDAGAQQNEENKSTDKDAYLYDKMMATDKGEAQQIPDAETTKQAEKASETKTEQSKEAVQNNESVNSAKQEVAQLGETLRSDHPNVDPNNNIAEALNENMSLESKMALIRMQEDQMREHISITLEELGMNDTPDVLRVSEPEAVSPPSAVQTSKYNRRS